MCLISAEIARKLSAMSIWGKFEQAVGGMLGALADLLRPGVGIETAEPDIVFTIAVIALAAKMAKADGIVTPDEVAVFERLFRVAPAESANVRRLFNLARRDTAGYETYARQIARRFASRPGLLEDILDGLFEIAKADGVLHPGESEFLERVADIFGFAPNEFRRIRASHFAPEASDPYVVLGLAYDAGEDEVRRTFLKLVRENHPDSLIGRGVPPEFVRLATEKLAAINVAYEKLKAERNWKG